MSPYRRLHAAINKNRVTNLHQKIAYCSRPFEVRNEDEIQLFQILVI